MTTPSSPAAVPLALLAGALLLSTAACDGGSGSGGATAAPTVTVTQTETQTPSATPSTSALPTVSSPRATGGTGGGTATCTASSLRVRYADDPGGAGAGSVNGTLTFTSRASEPCTLRGFPGVSYVAGSAGTQVGQAATRTDDAVTTKTLKPGASVRAALRRTQPRNYGDSCDQTDVEGFRVYPPGSTEAVFVPFPTTGCRSSSAPLLQVGPVR